MVYCIYLHYNLNELEQSSWYMGREYLLWSFLFIPSVLAPLGCHSFTHSLTPLYQSSWAVWPNSVHSPPARYLWKTKLQEVWWSLVTNLSPNLVQGDQRSFETISVGGGYSYHLRQEGAPHHTLFPWTLAGTFHGSLREEHLLLDLGILNSLWS